jgi:Protein of unknown function (DUF433)
VAGQFRKARKAAGLPNDLVLYCARHGFGTEMYRATKNLFAVKSLANGDTPEEILADFPSLKAEDVQVAIVFAAASAEEDLPVSAIPQIQ